MRSRNLLYCIAALCIGFLAFAVYLQHFKGVETCPLCVLQRYAFVLLAIFCLVGARFSAPKAGAFFGFVAALSGAGVAGWQVWLRTQPGVSCGYDPIETVINQLITAKWVPYLFYAEGSCTNDKFQLFGFSTPQWSLFWFAVFALTLLFIMLRRSGR